MAVITNASSPPNDFDVLVHPPAAASSLAGLADVNVTNGPTIDGKVLTYDDATDKWIASTPSGSGSTTLHALTDVNIAEGAGIDGKALTWDNATSRWIASTIPSPATTLHALTDVNVTEGAGIDAKALVWDNATSKWIASTRITTLQALTDINVTEGAGIDGKALTWNNATSKWVATALTTTLQGLTDVNVTEGSTIDGKTLTWDNATSKWVAAGVKSNITGSDPGVSNDTTQGYSVGSQWLNNSTMRRFICGSATTGAAKWEPLGYAMTSAYTAGRSYPAGGTTQTTSSSTVNLGLTTMALIPVVFQERCTLDQVTARIVTLFSGGLFQCALYASLANGLPTGTALANTASGSTTSATSVSVAFSANPQVEPGTVYWLAAMVNNATATFSYYSTSTHSIFALVGSTTASTGLQGNSVCCLTAPYTTYGTWPDLTGATFGESTGGAGVVLNFRVNSVP